MPHYKQQFPKVYCAFLNKQLFLNNFSSQFSFHKIDICAQRIISHPFVLNMSLFLCSNVSLFYCKKDLKF